MATTTVTHPGAGLDCRAAIQAAADANPNNILLLPASISAVWDVTGYADPGGHGNDNLALGALELHNNILQLAPGVTLQESHTTPLQGKFQALCRWKGASQAGIVFGAGSKFLGYRAGHITTDEWWAGAKFIGCTNVQISGSGETNFDSFHGDGFWFASGAYESQPTNGFVTVTNVLTSNNYRHGCTIEDAGILRMVGCGGTGNDGTGSSCWCDIEPDNNSDKLTDVQLTLGNIQGHAIGVSVNLEQLDNSSSPILVRISAADVTLGGGSDDPWGIRFQNTVNGPPSGLVDFLNVVNHNLKSAGVRVNCRLDSGVLLRILNTMCRQCSSLQADHPIDLAFVGAPTGAGVILDIQTEDTLNRQAVNCTSSGGTAVNVRGKVRASSPARSLPQPLLPNVQIIDGYSLLERNSPMLRETIQYQPPNS